MTATQYTGPAYWNVKAQDEGVFDVEDMHGKRVGTYPNAELAHKVRKDLEKKAMRDYLKKGKQ